MIQHQVLLVRPQESCSKLALQGQWPTYQAVLFPIHFLVSVEVLLQEQWQKLKMTPGNLEYELLMAVGSFPYHVQRSLSWPVLRLPRLRMMATASAIITLHRSPTTRRCGTPLGTCWRSSLLQSSRWGCRWEDCGRGFFYKPYLWMAIDGPGK